MDELRKHADQMYEVICSALDKKGWQYAKNEEKQQVIFVANAEDVSLSVGIGVDERKQRIYLQSPLEIKVCEDKRLDMTIAICEANSILADGCLEYDMSEGMIGFRISVSLWDSKVGEGLIDYLIGSAYAVNRKFGTMFDKFNKGQISIDEFMI